MQDMTVRRLGEATFNTDRAILVATTRTILAANPTYKNTQENGDGSVTTSVKPAFYLASTPMRISFEEVGANTIVKVSTTSQPFIIGDRWDTYNRYIQDFLQELKRAAH
jgi:hypothetical protein